MYLEPEERMGLASRRATSTVTGAEPLELDVTGLKCVLPLIRLQKALQGLKSKDRILLIADDPDLPPEIQQLCRAKDHTVIEISRNSKRLVFLIEKG